MTGFGKRMSRVGRGLLAATVLAGLAAGVASANPDAPSLKPSAVAESRWMEQGEFTLLSRALDSADDQRLGEVRTALGRLNDPAAKALLRWRIATDPNGMMGFSDLSNALEEFKGWPGYSDIEDQAEKLISRSGLTGDERIAWLKARGPQTGEGVLALADAYNSAGKRDEMLATIRQAWRTMPMSSDAARTIQATYGAELSAEDHYARADMHLWRGDISATQSLIYRLSAGRKELVDARIALLQNKKTAEAGAASLPSEYQDDPGLLLARAMWRERRGQQSGELDMLLRINGEAAPDAGREAIWGEKQSVIRRLIRERDYQNAYRLAAGHGLSPGEAFRDAEWTAGWIALSKLRDPVKAEAHFRTFAAGVSTPISTSRAQYWLAEALMAQEKGAEAQAAYEAAARYPYVFYGQLAAEKVKARLPELGKISFALPASPTDADRAAFARTPIVRAAILLAETGRFASFERFSYAIDDNLATAMEHQMLFDIAAGYLEMRAAVRGAKAGLGRGLVAPDAVFPVLDLPKSPRTGSAEPALVLALSRQESEFNHRAISAADARGLMQMVPRYAQAEARMVGLPFRSSWLTDDPQYNLRLGRGFLDDLVDDYNGSYILAAAAYNAGPSRARQWIADFGDPRGGGVDPVDWIESVPFSETRNYIQRVLANTQVYRHRLTGQPVEITLSKDLRRGTPN
ncbi:MAG TPA: lytic transglycosylase domain-containing protein [Hyphomonadaceae bacterium]|nr:lytic transglycosylase domain-containing protein [Hyphomonadaceae bacterium]